MTHETKGTARFSAAEITDRVEGFRTWYHRVEVAPGIVTPGVNDSAGALKALDALGLPLDCRGLTALDIGTRDGFFAFELERRGADVRAIDFMPPERTGFPIAKELLGSKVEYEIANVYDLNANSYGQFDIVLFLGVLYHLRNPLLAFDRLREVCRGSLWLETQLIDEAFLDPVTRQMTPLHKVAPALAKVPIMQFYPGRMLNDDPTNWWAPNMACLVAMLEDAEFRVESTFLNGARGLARCVPTESALSRHLNRAERSVAL